MQHQSSENIYKIFIRYVSLNVFSMIGVSCYILADTIFISWDMGSNGLTALNLALPVYSFINGIGLMIGMGAATRFSIQQSNQNQEKANKIFSQAVMLSIILGVIFVLIGLLFSDEMSILLGANEAVLSMTNTYLKTILVFAPAFILNNLLVCFIRNDKKPHLSMVAMLTGSFSNIILDYVFIFPLKLGIFGAAFATGLAPIISLSILSVHFIFEHNHFKLVRCRPDINSIMKTLSIGIPSFISEFSSGIVMLTFNFSILNLTGNVGVAACGIVMNLAMIIVAIFNGIGQGIQPIFSSRFGQGKFKDIKIIYQLALIVAFIFGFFAYITGLVFPENLISMFNSEHNAALSAIAKEGIFLYFTAFLIMGINIITLSLFSSIARPLQSFIICIMRGCVGILPFIFILPRFAQMQGVWISVTCAELVTLVISITFMAKAHNKLFKT